jgi:chromosomal replication initiator protein
LEELTHTLDALDDAGAGVAVSARVGPGQWSGWPRRLVNRLLGGLAVRVDPPGLASRRRYLLDRARARGIGLSSEAVDSLAEAADGYRTLDGWLANLALTARIDRRPLDGRLVAPFLEEDGALPPLTIDEIARAVAARFGVPLRDLRASTRRKTIVEPRHLAMHLARTLTGQSFQAIGTYFGGRDTKTVRHACRMASARLAADPALAAAVDSLRLRRRSPSPADERPLS